MQNFIGRDPEGQAKFDADVQRVFDWLSYGYVSSPNNKIGMTAFKGAQTYIIRSRTIEEGLEEYISLQNVEVKTSFEVGIGRYVMALDTTKMMNFSRCINLLELCKSLRFVSLYPVFDQSLRTYLEGAPITAQHRNARSIMLRYADMIGETGNSAFLKKILQSVLRNGLSPNDLTVSELRNIRGALANLIAYQIVYHRVDINDAIDQTHNLIDAADSLPGLDPDTYELIVKTLQRFGFDSLSIDYSQCSLEWSNYKTFALLLPELSKQKRPVYQPNKALDYAFARILDTDFVLKTVEM